MAEKRAYKRYPKEFKEEAVALVREQGYSVAQAAEAVGVTTTVLYKWKEKLEAQLEGIALSDDERDELSDYVEKLKSYAWKRKS
ncbi:transposase [Vibrio coralliirubri]|nr:transposase [Vibrio coralliirubri]